MLNVPELERRWKRYRRARRTPLIAGSILGAASLVGISLLFLSGNPFPETSPAQKPVTAAATPQTAPVETVTSATPLQTVPSGQTPAATPHETAAAAMPQTPEPPQAKTQSPQTKLSPSMSFMNDFESDVMDYYIEDEERDTAPSVQSVQPAPQPQRAAQPARSDTSALPSIVADTPPPSTVVVQNNPPQPAPVQNVQQAMPSEHLVIQRDDEMKDVQDVIARFKKNKNPALSLFVAKRYYGTGNYQQAYNYALMTNELDSNIEDSWLIFAQSLYKLDQKDMAIKTLKTYTQQSGSVKAKITLEQMQSGTFK